MGILTTALPRYRTTTLRYFIYVAILAVLCVAGCGDRHPSVVQDVEGDLTIRNKRGESMSVGDSLDHWKQFGGPLQDAIEYSDRLVSTEDVDALADALRTFHSGKVPSATGEALDELAALFQQLESEELFETAKDVALPHLRPFIDDAISDAGVWSERGEMMALKIIAMYGVAEDVQLLSRAIEAQIHPDHHMWQVVLRSVRPENGRQLLERIGNDIPSDLIGVCILDLANSLVANEYINKHPFDSDEGVARLANYIRSRDSKKFTYAGSSVMAIPFLDASRRNQLLVLAREHPEFQVRTGAAWAGVKVGEDGSVELLVDLAAEVNSHHLASRYLEDLGLQHRIPEAARTPEFQAKAELAVWLSHPNELGEYPDSIEVVDHRTLYWPPTEDERDVWLLRYSSVSKEDGPKIGIGMVGSTTFVLFGVTETMTVEDIYVEHCAWELRNANPDILARLKTDNRDEARRILTERNASFGR